MHDQRDAPLLQKIALDLIHHVVADGHILLRRHFHMHAGEAAGRAVVVHHQVVRAQHPGVGHDGGADLLHHFGIGRRAQQRVDGIADQPPARPEDEDSDRKAHPAIDVQTEDTGGQQGKQHRRGGDDIVAAVGRGSQQRARIDQPAHPGIKARQPELDQDGKDQDAQAQGAEHGSRGTGYLFKAGSEKLDADNHNEHSHGQAGQILIARVAEGMLPVRGLARQLEADQADDARGGIAQVVDGVGHHSDGAR